MESFGIVSICKCNDRYFYHAIPVRHVQDGYSVRKFVLISPSFCHLELTQKDKRLSREERHSYLQGRIILIKKGENDIYEIIDGVWGCQRNLTLEVQLDEGEYYVLSILNYERK